MQLRERIIPNSEMEDVNSNFNSAVEASLLELERFLHWSSGQDLLVVPKRTPLLPHAKMLPVPIHFFFLASRSCSRGFYALTEQM